MRSSGGQGAYCDRCGIHLTPFNIYRVRGFIDMKGPKHSTCSSDVINRTLNTFHLCKTCYEQVINSIKVLVK